MECTVPHQASFPSTWQTPRLEKYNFSVIVLFTLIIFCREDQQAFNFWKIHSYLSCYGTLKSKSVIQMPHVLAQFQLHSNSILWKWHLDSKSYRMYVLFMQLPLYSIQLMTCIKHHEKKAQVTFQALTKCSFKKLYLPIAFKEQLLKLQVEIETTSLAKGQLPLSESM